MTQLIVLNKITSILRLCKLIYWIDKQRFNTKNFVHTQNTKDPCLIPCTEKKQTQD